MDLSPRQRQLVFAVTVVVLAGLGFFLVRSGTSGHHSAPKPSASVSAPVPGVSSPAAVPVPSQTSSSSTASSQVNIYQWLPFTEQQLAKAAAVVTQFGAYYGTYSYTESTASYVGRMQGLVTSQLAQVIANGYATPGVAKIRTQQKQVSAGSAVIDSLRAFGSQSLTFVVTVNQKITGTSPSQQSAQYAIPVTDGSGSWQVSDIQLASAGNT
jgi:hypothetical protein